MPEPKTPLPEGWTYDAATDCVVCECMFRFGSEHEDQGGGYSCPACEVLFADECNKTERQLVAGLDTLTNRN